MAATKPLLKRGDMTSRWKAASGAYMRNLRDETGMTQAEVADIIYGSENDQNVSHVECGRIMVPPERAESYANLYGVPHDVLGKALLRWQNPWLYALIYGADEVLRAELKSIAGIPAYVGPSKKKISVVRRKSEKAPV